MERDVMPVSLIVLAAGKGTRMNSDLPKVLHPLGAAPILHHALTAGRALEPRQVVVIAGHGAEAVTRSARAFDPEIQVAVQHEQLGTGHAVAQAAPLLSAAGGDAIVLYGDTPFVRAETLQKMREARARHGVVVLGFEAADPGRYGRLITEGNELRRIVEWKDATPEERDVRLCNSGVICMDGKLLFDLVARIGNDNAAGEYYLTDIVTLARAAGHSAGVVRCEEAETLGINTRAELAVAERLFQDRMRHDALENGVTLSAPETVFFALDTHLGRDCVVGPNVVFGPGVTVETGAEIRAFCHLEGCHVSRGATIGPFARLRPGAELAEDVHVGNFVEIKNAVLEEGVKVGHLTYIGDAHIGERTNIGAGTVTCNYNGIAKHRTQIGAHSFIGSNTLFVAPVSVGRDAMTGSGSVITENVPDEALALGRARQENKPGFAPRLLERYRAEKAQTAKES